MKKKVVHCEVTSEEVGGNQAKLIRKFCKKVKKLGIIEEVRDRQYFVKPSKKKRMKKLNKKRMVAREAEENKRISNY